LDCFPCGSPITINHIAGTTSPISKSVTYATTANIPGETIKCWITQNLGADHQATMVNDATEESAVWSAILFALLILLSLIILFKDKLPYLPKDDKLIQK
jgi:hypothetical protein